MDSAYGDKALKKTAIYAILKKVKAGENTADLRHLNPKKRRRIPAVIASVMLSLSIPSSIKTLGLLRSLLGGCLGF